MELSIKTIRKNGQLHIEEVNNRDNEGKYFNLVQKRIYCGLDRF